MSTSKLLRTGVLALSVLFSSLAMAGGAMAGEQNDITGAWENDSIGMVDIQPCENDASKFCGYLLETTPEAMEEFQLSVDQTSDSVQGTLVMDGLQSNEDGSKFTKGSFQNTDSSKAQRAKLTVNYDGDVMNVRASIGWFGEDFAFSRVDTDSTIQVASAGDTVPEVASVDTDSSTDNTTKFASAGGDVDSKIASVDNTSPTVASVDTEDTAPKIASVSTRPVGPGVV